MARTPITQQPSNRSRIWTSIIILFVLFIIAAMIAALFGADSEDLDANTAIIRVNGPISTADAGGLFAEGGASSTEIVEQIERARENDRITGIIIEIDSPGGSAVASDEIAQAIKDARADGIVTVAWIREMGASGGYWVASSTDHIVAHRMSITGSIGVISSYMEFAEFLDDWNVTYRRLVAGERKDIGDPFTELTPGDRAFLQAKLDRIHGYFISEIATNRNMTYDEVARLADGQFYLGVEAYDAGLVDELGGYAQAVAYIENRTGTDAVTTYYEDDATFFEELFGVEAKAAPTLEEIARAKALNAESRAVIPQLR